VTAYGHLNLRRNPFGELTRQEWQAVAVCDAEALAAALTPGTAVQVVARCGRGKTTHLLAIGRCRPEARYVRPDTDGVPEGSWDVLLLDEADRLWPWTRWRLLRSARAVALAVHGDRTWELRALGFRVVTVRPIVDAERLSALIERRVEVARRAPGAVPRVPMPSVRALLDRHGDDVRAVVTDLYERFQRLPGAIDVVV
jgi:hypothetical protein